MERFAENTRTACYLISVALTLGLLLPTPAGAAVLPVGQPEYDFIYERLVRSDSRSRDYFDYQLGPYQLDRFADSLKPFSQWCRPAVGEMRLFAFAAEDYRAVRKSRGLGYESVRAGVAGTPFTRVSLYADFVLDEESAKDKNYTGKKWRGLAGNVNQAFLSYVSDRVTLMVGRFGSFWGPRSSLVLSPGQKLDGLGYSVRWGRATLSYRLGALDGLNPDEHEVEQFEPRYLAAHRVDFHFSRSLRLGVFETVVFGGPGRQIDLFYLNPLIFFHGSQLNENLNDNTTVGFDLDFKPTDGCKLYGQVLVDDIQLDDKNHGDKEPDQIGLIAGAYLADLLPMLDVQAEYSRVSNWTFNQMHERNRYLNDGRPIGGALGNDYDLADLKFSRWWRDDLQSSVNFRFRRQGQGRIDAEWTQPWVDAEGDYSEPFPTGVVWKTGTVSLGLKGFPARYAFVDFEAGVDWIRNRSHVAGENKTRPFVRIYLSGFLVSELGID